MTNINTTTTSTRKRPGGRFRRLRRVVGGGAVAIMLWELASLGVFVLVADDAVDTLAGRIPVTTPAETGRWAPAVGVGLQGHEHVPDPGLIDTTIVEDPARLDAYTDAATYGNGVAGAFTTRWDGPAVTYRIDLPADYPPGVADEIDTAFRWVNAVTGMRFIRTATMAADISIVGRADNGGQVHYDAPVGRLTRAAVEIGCCRRGVIWEEVLHAAGLAHDAGPPDSLVAAHPRTRPPRDTPGVGDATALAELYQHPAGTPAEVYRAALATTTARTADQGPP